MDKRVYNKFLLSDDTLRVYLNTQLLFASKRDKLAALIEYIDGPASEYQEVTILDKVEGNAAALLAIKADSIEVWSPLASQSAISTLQKHGLRYRFDKAVPFIRRDDNGDLCPMEKLSFNKEPDVFYEEVRNLVSRHS